METSGINWGLPVVVSVFLIGTVIFIVTFKSNRVPEAQVDGVKIPSYVQLIFAMVLATFFLWVLYGSFAARHKCLSVLRAGGFKETVGVFSVVGGKPVGAQKTMLVKIGNDSEFEISFSGGGLCGVARSAGYESVKFDGMLVRVRYWRDEILAIDRLNQ